MNNSFRYFILSLTLLSLILVSMSTALAGDGKIPITTKSEKAREYFLKGRDLSEKLRFNDAREYFRMAVEEDPDFAMAWSQLSFTEPSGKEFFEDHNKAYALKDKASDGEKLQIEIQRAQVKGDGDLALKLSRQLAEEYPKDERALNQLGNVLFGRLAYKESIAVYEKAVAINPDFSQPYNQMGYANRFIGDFDKAEQAFKKYIKLIPDDPNPYDSYAELLMEMGEYRKSIANYEKALDINPQFTNSFLGIASDYNFMGKHKDALRELKRLLAVARDNGQRRQAHFGMAVCYVDKGSFDNAIEELYNQLSYAEAIEDHNNMAGDYFNIGSVYLEMGESDKAAEAFNLSLENALKSDLSDYAKENARRIFVYNSARVAIADLRVNDAISGANELLDKATAAGNPFQIRLAHELLATVALLKENNQKALDHLKQTNLRNPYNLYRMAVAYDQMGDKQNSKKYQKMAREFNALNNLNQSFVRAKNGTLVAASL